MSSARRWGRIAGQALSVVVLTMTLGAVSQPAERQRWERLASQVTIYRDKWGVAHVHGTTDAAALFGSTYARAEDRFEEQEPYWYRALGRVAEAEGEDGVGWDVLMRALEIERLSREEYTSASPAVRALVEAFADGLNYFLWKHPEVKPRTITRFEPWHAFAFHRSLGISVDASVDLRALASIVSPPRPSEPDASNMWAVAPSRSASGRAMLFLNPHTPLQPVYELHLIGDRGWNVSGMNAYALTMVPVMGHNEHLAWALTVNYPDIADLYEVTFVQAIWRGHCARREASRR